MSDFYTPTSISNEALDAAGVDFFLGDITEGTRPAQVCLRHYWTLLRQLLRAANWNMARKQAPLLLLADATGQTPNVGTQVPSTQFVYAYALPRDCAKVRYIPWNPFLTPATPPGNIVPVDPDAPLTTNSTQPPYAPRQVVPARFLVSSDQNNIPAGADNSQPGVSPLGRSVIMCNVQQAQCIYTYDAVYPNVWDEKFRAAMVATLAAFIAIPLAKDKKFGMAMRAQNIQIAEMKIKEARVSDGNESWSSSSLAVDWMNFRNAGGGSGFGGAWWSPYAWNIGDFNCGYDSMGFGTGNSSAY